MKCLYCTCDSQDAADYIQGMRAWRLTFSLDESCHHTRIEPLALVMAGVACCRWKTYSAFTLAYLTVPIRIACVLTLFIINFTILWIDE